MIELAIGLFYIAFLIFIVLATIYLIFKRQKEKKSENFEKREN